MMTKTHNSKTTIFGLISLAFIAVAGATYFMYNLGIFEDHSEKIASLSKYRSLGNTTIHDRNNVKLGDFFNQYQIYVEFKDIPTHLVQAIVATEDRNFWTHSGFDIKGIVRAGLVVARRHLFNSKRSLQGASTITQQVVRHFFLTKHKTVKRKVREILLAIKLEKKLSKEKIFELYVNNMFLGNGSYGIAAAAKRYFNKKIEDLNLEESATIAGLFQLPTRYNPAKYPEMAKRRQLIVLNAMFSAGYLSSQELQIAKAREVVIKQHRNINFSIAPYFIDYVRTEAQKSLHKDNVEALDSRGYKIQTSLDSRLQKVANAAIQKHINVFDQQLKNKDAKIETALLAVKVDTGEILAMVGGRDYNTSQYNRTSQSLRSPGSLFKTIVVSTALELGYQWNHLFFIDPIAHENYRPKSSNRDYFTESTMMRAFYRSINAPILELAQSIGIKKIISRARSLGVTSPLKEELGTAIGGSSTTMMDMAQVYQSYANKGMQNKIFAIQNIVDHKNNRLFRKDQLEGRQVLAPSIASMVYNGLNNVMIYGTGSSSYELGKLGFGGKTGTSNDYRDNWFIGFSDQILTAVWVGSDENKALSGPFGGNKLALPIWHDFMKQSLAIYPSKQTAMDPSLVSTKINANFGYADEHGVKIYMHKAAPLPKPKEHSALSILSQTNNFRNILR